MVCVEDECICWAPTNILIWNYVTNNEQIMENTSMWTYITKNLICQCLGKCWQNMEKQVCSKLHLQVEQVNMFFQFQQKTQRNNRLEK